MTQLFDPDEFWNFSGQIYSQAGVKECCLTLQNHHNVDINLLFLCCWIDEQQLVITEAVLQELMELSKIWQTRQLNPLRAARIKLEKGSASYQTAVKHELDTEKKEQRALINLLNQPKTLDHKRPFSSGTNCDAYATTKPFPIDEFFTLTSPLARP